MWNNDTGDRSRPPVSSRVGLPDPLHPMLGGLVLRTKHLLIPVTLVALLLGLGMACRATVNYDMYAVAPGDTLTSIAARFGTSVDRICELNGFAATTPLRAGQSVAVPLPAADTAKQAATVTAQKKEGAVIGHLGTIIGDKVVTITAKPGAGSTLYKSNPGTRLVITDQQGEYYGLLMVDGTTGWIAKRVVQLSDVELAATPPPPTPTPAQQNELLAGRTDVLAAAMRYWGTPYRLGGTLPASVDCSLLVQTAFKQCGVKLPRTAAEQANVGYAVNSVEEALPGDRLYFVMGKDGRISHTGLYIGNGQFLHASSNRGMVAVDDLAGHYLQRLVAIRR